MTECRQDLRLRVGSITQLRAESKVKPRQLTVRDKRDHLVSVSVASAVQEHNEIKWKLAVGRT